MSLRAQPAGQSYTRIVRGVAETFGILNNTWLQLSVALAVLILYIREHCP